MKDIQTNKSTIKNMSKPKNNIQKKKPFQISKKIYNKGSMLKSNIKLII